MKSLAAATALITGLMTVGTACSSGDDTEELSAAAAALAVEFLVTDDDLLKCQKLATPRLVEEIFGDQESCEQDAEDSDGEGGFEDVEALDTVLDGDSATVTVSGVFAERDVAGSLDLLRDGDTWQVDAYGADLVRSMLAEAIQGNYVTESEKDGVTGVGALLERSDVGECVAKEYDDLGGERLRAIAYSLIADREDPDDLQELSTIFVRCMEDDPDGQATLRLGFEHGFRESLSRFPAGFVDCVLERLRRSADDDQVAAAVVADLTDDPAAEARLDALNTLGERAATECDELGPPEDLETDDEDTDADDSDTSDTEEDEGDADDADAEAEDEVDEA